MFLQVSVCPGGCLHPLGRHPLGQTSPRQQDTPPVRHTSLLSRQSPWADTPNGQRPNWADIPPHHPRWPLQGTVRILLECILVPVNIRQLYLQETMLDEMGYFCRKDPRMILVLISPKIQIQLFWEHLLGPVLSYLSGVD